MPIAEILGLEYDEIKNFRGPVRRGPDLTHTRRNFLCPCFSLYSR